MGFEDRGNAFGQFKVLVTKPDGSTESKTLAELGITEINLEGDATEITLPDGSRITAQTTFTRSNGTTGTVADTVLMAEADGHHVVQTTTTDAAGTRTVETKAYDAGGNLAYAITSVTSVDGLSISNSYDDNGDGWTIPARRNRLDRNGRRMRRSAPVPTGYAALTLSAVTRTLMRKFAVTAAGNLKLCTIIAIPEQQSSAQ